jgi:hypothetical protein
VRALLAVLLVACGEGATLIVDPMGAEQCERFCAEMVEVDSGGETVTAPCGEQIALPNIAIGEQVTLAVRVIGGVELTGTAEIVAADGEELEVSVSLAPTSRPRIDVVLPSSPIAYGPIELRIEGSGFGAPRGEHEVTVGGVALDADEGWSDAVITAMAEHPGDVVVKSCGIASDPEPVLFQSVRETLLATLPASCSEARMLAGETSAGASRLGAIASCGACESGLILRIDTAAENVDSYGPVPGCPLDISLFGAQRSVVASDAGLYFCDQTAGELCRMPETPPLPEGRVLDVTVLTGTTVAFLVEPAPGEPRCFYRRNDRIRNGNQQRVLNQLADVVAIHERLAVGIDGTGAAVLVDWQSLAALEIDLLGGCSPLGLRVRASRRVVLCDGLGEPQVEDLGDALFTVYVRDFVDAAIDQDGAQVWVWAGDRLWFVDLETENVLGSRSMPYPPSSLVRAANANVFVFGGPEPGQLTRLAIE